MYVSMYIYVYIFKLTLFKLKNQRQFTYFTLPSPTSGNHKNRKEL